MTRYAAFVVLLPLGSYILFTVMKGKEKWKYLPLAVTIGFCSDITSSHHKKSKYHCFLGHNWLKEWTFLNFFKSAFHSGDGINQYVLPNIFYAFSAVFDPRYFLPVCF